MDFSFRTFLNENGIDNSSLKCPICNSYSLDADSNDIKNTKAFCYKCGYIITGSKNKVDQILNLMLR